MARRRISVEKVIRYGVTTDLSERAIGRALQVSYRGGQVPGVVPRQRTDLGAGAGAARQRAGERVEGPSRATDQRALRATGLALSYDGQGVCPVARPPLSEEG